MTGATGPNFSKKPKKFMLKKTLSGGLYNMHIFTSGKVKQVNSKMRPSSSFYCTRDEFFQLELISFISISATNSHLPNQINIFNLQVKKNNVKIGAHCLCRHFL